MPFVSLTRLRIRAIRLLPGFVWHSQGTLRQLHACPGFLGGGLLADRRWVFWTMTAWDDEASMRGFMTGGAHQAAMPLLARWCDEAAVAHWRQEDAALPSWREAAARLKAQGRASPVRHPSAEHATLGFAMPRLRGAVTIRPREKPLRSTGGEPGAG